MSHAMVENFFKRQIKLIIYTKTICLGSTFSVFIAKLFTQLSFLAQHLFLLESCSLLMVYQYMFSCIDHIFIGNILSNVQRRLVASLFK